MPNSLRGREAFLSFLPRAAALLVCILLVFLLPYAFPPAAGISMSYMAGFNNHVVVVALLVCSAALGLTTRGFGLRLGELSTSAKSSGRWVLWVALSVAAVLSTGIWLRARTSTPVMEAGYFLDRYAMHAMGYRLFRDISFDYGPLMFLPAVWLRGLLHLTPGDAFYLWWVLNWVGGTALLWWTLQRLPAPPRHRTWLFVIAMALLLTMLPTSGVNYTPLRYTLASAAAMAVYGVQRRSVPLALALGLLCEAAVLAYSPEQGISFALGTILFFAVGLRRRSVVVPLLVFTAASAGLLTVAARLGLFQTIVDFGGGGYDLPLLFSTSTLVLVTLLLLSGCAAIGAFFQHAEHRPELYLIAVALFATPAAFGRADAGHIFVNTMPAVLVTLLILFRAPRGRWAGIALAALLAVPAVFLQLPNGLYGVFGPHVVQHLRAMLHQPGLAVDTQATERAAIGRLLTGQSEPQIFAPFGYSQPASQRIPLPISTGRLAGYGLVSERFPQAKIAELQRRNDTYLLLPSHFDQACEAPSAEWLHAVLRLTLNGWYTPTMKHTTHVSQALCGYIHQRFVPASQTSPVPGWMLYERMPLSGKL